LLYELPFDAFDCICCAKGRFVLYYGFFTVNTNRNAEEKGICLLFNQFFVRIYVQSAMKAFAEVEEGHAVHMKIVAAAGAPGQGRNSRDDAEKEQPENKNHGRGVEGLCQTES
jgi:hypothetical protein